MNAPDIPIIIGGLGDFLGKEGFGKSCTEYNFINQELEKFAFEQDNCYFVTASGLTSNPDTFLIGISYELLGCFNEQKKLPFRRYKNNRSHN